VVFSGADRPLVTSARPLKRHRLAGGTDLVTSDLLPQQREAAAQSGAWLAGVEQQQGDPIELA
jgi:hypothetical protein